MPRRFCLWISRKSRVIEQLSSFFSLYPRLQGLDFHCLSLRKTVYFIAFRPVFRSVHRYLLLLLYLYKKYFFLFSTSNS